MKTKILFCIAALCGATLTASAQPRIGITLRIGAPPPVIVHEEPPRPVLVEYQSFPASPGPTYVWVRTHHRWVEGRWVRVQGGWVVPPRPDAAWVEGRWDATTRSWTEEHWEISRPAGYAISNIPPPPNHPWRDENWENNRPVNYVTPAPAQPYAPSAREPSSGYSDNHHGNVSSAEISFGFAPPALRHDPVSPRPSRQHTWIAGYWTGNHGRHEWVAGHWEIPPREHQTWVAPRWEQHDRNYLFVGGYWR
jgi:hypothetical protein